MTENNEFILLKTYKHGSGTFIYELPSGSIDYGETPGEGIRREMMEETGYFVDPSNLKKAGELLVDPTYTQAKMYLFFADKAVYTGGKADDPKEIFEIILVSVKDAESFIIENMSFFPESQVAAIFLIKELLNGIFPGLFSW